MDNSTLHHCNLVMLMRVDEAGRKPRQEGLRARDSHEKDDTSTFSLQKPGARAANSSLASKMSISTFPLIFPPLLVDSFRDLYRGLRTS